jgi:cytochrome P450
MMDDVEKREQGSLAVVEYLENAAAERRRNAWLDNVIDILAASTKLVQCLEERRLSIITQVSHSRPFIE